jgi:hypothetical protein
MKLIYLIGVPSEIDQLPPAERKAMLNALDKLAILGDQPDYPHTSQIKETDLREVRPRAGRSPWRALYQRDAGVMLVAAISPEAQHDARGFQRATKVAHTCLQEYKSGGFEDD